MGNPVPTQTRTIDPYASYNSDVANRQIRSITNGDDCLLVVNPIDVSIDSSSTIICSAGMAAKDDVLIETSSLSIDMTDLDYYEGGVIWSVAGYHYVVLKYDYTKVAPAPTASIYILLPSERAAYISDPSSYVFLACLDVSSGPLNVDQVLLYDPDNPDDSKRILRGLSASFDDTLTGGDWGAIADPTYGNVYRATVNHALGSEFLSCSCYENDEMIYPLKIETIDIDNLYVYMPTNTSNIEVHCV
jgi:hypothetical protein